MINNTVFREKTFQIKESNLMITYASIFTTHSNMSTYLESKSRQDSDPPKVYKDTDLGIV